MRGSSCIWRMVHSKTLALFDTYKRTHSKGYMVLLLVNPHNRVHIVPHSHHLECPVLEKERPVCQSDSKFNTHWVHPTYDRLFVIGCLRIHPRSLRPKCSLRHWRPDHLLWVPVPFGDTFHICAAKWPIQQNLALNVQKYDFECRTQRWAKKSLIHSGWDISKTRQPIEYRTDCRVSLHIIQTREKVNRRWGWQA